MRHRQRIMSGMRKKKNGGFSIQMIMTTIPVGGSWISSGSPWSLTHWVTRSTTGGFERFTSRKSGICHLETSPLTPE